MRLWLLIGSISALLAVLIGAMGAHSLEPLMSDEGLGNFETASSYHMWHSLALLLCGLLWPHCGPEINQTKYLKYAGIFILSGMILFSGNLYILAIFGTNPLHLLIPVGGLSLMTGWILMIMAIWKTKKENR